MTISFARQHSADSLAEVVQFGDGRQYPLGRDFTYLAASRRIRDPGPYPAAMLPPCNFTGFMIAPRPTGWVQDGERWALWRNGREIAAVQPDAKGVRVRLSCRKLWEDKEVRAASIAQGKR